MDRRIAGRIIVEEGKWILEHFNEADYLKSQLTREEVRLWIEEGERLLNGGRGRTITSVTS